MNLFKLRFNKRIFFPGILILLNLLFILLIVKLLLKVMFIVKNKDNKSKFEYKLNQDYYIKPIDTNLNYYYELKPDVVQMFDLKWMNGEVNYSINSNGLNERFNYSFNKNKNTYRIITLGDSLTFGANVDTKNNYPEQLEDFLNNHFKCENIRKFEVINLGVPGFDVEYSIEIFRRKGIMYNPDLILWFLNYWNLDNINEIKIPIYNNLKNQGIPDFDEKTGSHSAHEIAADKMFKNYGFNNILDINKKKLLDFIDIYKNNLVILTYNDILPKYKNLITDISKSKDNFYFFEIENLAIDKKLVLADRHPTVQGYQKIVSDLTEYLDKELLKECEINEKK